MKKLQEKKGGGKGKGKDVAAAQEGAAPSMAAPAARAQAAAAPTFQALLTAQDDATAAYAAARGHQ